MNWTTARKLAEARDDLLSNLFSGQIRVIRSADTMLVSTGGVAT